MSKSVLIVAVCLLGVLVLLPVLPRLVGNKEEKPQTAEAPAAAPRPEPSSGEPVVLSMNPPNGATNVDPRLGQLTVVFNVPMRGGFSWTGGGEHFPEGAGKPYWAPDRKTCTLPVKLKPNWSYRLGLNSKSHRNFKSATGVPLTPVMWTFTTGG